MVSNPDFTRKSLSNGAKLLAEEEVYVWDCHGLSQDIPRPLSDN